MKKPPLNERIRDLCKRRALTFKPWEITPWDVDDGPSPYPSTTSGATTWPKAPSVAAKADC